MSISASEKLSRPANQQNFSPNGFREIEDPVYSRTKEFMGINPLGIYVDPQSFKTASDGQKDFIQGIVSASEKSHQGGIQPLDSANTIFFTVGLGDEENGMFRYKNRVRNGGSGIAIVENPDLSIDSRITDREVWPILGNALTQYAVLLVRDGAFVLSMEGAHARIDFAAKGEEKGYLEVAERLQYLAGGEKATHHIYDRKEPLKPHEMIANQIIQSGKDLRAGRLLPHHQPADFLSEKQAAEINFFLEVSGLSVGNISAWDPDNCDMLITGTGLDKGNLKLEDISVIQGFNPDFNGTLVKGGPKPSVESFDQMLGYFADAVIHSGWLRTPDLRRLVELAKNPELVHQILSEGKMKSQSMIHLHWWPERWDEDLFEVIRVNPALVPNGSYHSSCGTLPLALYTTEAIMRGLLKTQGTKKILVILLPNHGFQLVSPYSLEDTTKLILPSSGRIEWGEVPAL